MSRISFAFFALSALCGLAGMIWGLWMGANEAMATYPAHAHLNLLGWLGLAMMGGFHALARGRVPPPLARANFALSASGAIVLPIGIALVLLGHVGATPLAIVGGLLALAGLVTFLGCILAAWIAAERAGTA